MGNVRETLTFSHEVQKGPSGVLNFSGGSLGVAAPTLSPRLGQQSMSNRLYMQKSILYIS